MSFRGVGQPPASVNLYIYTVYTRVSLTVAAVELFIDAVISTVGKNLAFCKLLPSSVF